MLDLRFSIRNQLLLLGALATGSIWAGALLQYLSLREQSQRLAVVRIDLDSANRFAELARHAAQERGLSNGWLLRPAGGSPADLVEVRGRVDRGVKALDLDPQARDEPAIQSRLGELARYRAQIDRRDVPAPAAFAYYTGLVAAVQDIGSRRLREGMVEVSLSYEHVNHLRRAAELLASVRGLTNGALTAGTISEEGAQALARQLTLHTLFLHLYDQAVPADARSAFASHVGAPVVREVTERASRLAELKQTGSVGLDPATWWTMATEAVDVLQVAATQEATALSIKADQRIRSIERQLWGTVVVLVALGLVSLGLVLATVGRIVRGLDRLLVGLEGVGARRNFNARIDDSRPDEFGVISSGVNKLMAIVGSVMDEQQQLTLTDPLTGVLNRRGFDAQIEARTRRERAHRVPLCVVMIDVDHFKAVNDSFGHASGDAVLRGLATLLRERLRPDDVLDRFGGEEFVALLTGCELAEALRAGDKLRAAVAAHDFAIGRSVTASFGVAAWHDGQPPQELVAAADAQLYRAKKAGRNCVMPTLLSAAA